MAVQNYKELIAWQKAMDLVVEVYQTTTAFPNDERFGLTNQVRRAAVSIPSNIAEGHSQRGDRVFLRHVRIALGSLAGLDTQVEIAIRTQLVDDGAARSLRIDLARTGKLLHGLRRTLRASTALATVGLLVRARQADWFGWVSQSKNPL